MGSAVCLGCCLVAPLAWAQQMLNGTGHHVAGEVELFCLGAAGLDGMIAADYPLSHEPGSCRQRGMASGAVLDVGSRARLKASVAQAPEFVHSGA